MLNVRMKLHGAPVWRPAKHEEHRNSYCVDCYPVEWQLNSVK